MMAIIRGRPSVPARAKEAGVPPTPIQTGSGVCTGRGVNRLARQWRAMPAGPVNVQVLPNFKEQIEFFGKEGIVVAELESEEGISLGEGAAPGHDFRPALRNQIQRGKLLKHPHRIGGAQDGHRAGQADTLSSRGGGGQDDYGRRIEKFFPVMFADTESIEAHPVGQLDLFEQVLQSHDRVVPRSGDRIGQRGNEAIDSNFHPLRSTPA